MAEGRKTRKKQQTDLKGNVSGWHIYKDEREELCTMMYFLKQDIF